jgi:ubiquinone/menaquinone biosynthesis C-methylase UbiE
MNRERFSFLAHRYSPNCNPISEAKLRQAIQAMRLETNDHVLDIGCGRGEFLIQLAEQFGIQGYGVDQAAMFLNAARHAASVKDVSERIQWLEGDANDTLSKLPKQPFRLISCIGASQALGGYTSTLDRCMSWLGPKSYLLIGEGYWKQPPAHELLLELQSEPDSMVSHSENLRLGMSRGLIPVWSQVASQDEWDTYEWQYSSSIEDFVEENPEDPDAQSMLKRSRWWRDVFLSWGRDTLGFGLYLFRTPANFPTSIGTG